MVIERNLARALDAEVNMNFDPGGLHCHIVIPAGQILTARWSLAEPNSSIAVLIQAGNARRFSGNRALLEGERQCATSFPIFWPALLSRSCCMSLLRLQV